MPRGNLIQVRRGTTSQWVAADTASATDPDRLLAAGEPGRDTTTGELKIGDGTTKFADLPAYLDQDAVADRIALSRSRLATRAGYDTARSAGYSAAADASASRIAETWADLAAWAVTSSSVQVSGGKLYGVSGGGGANRSFRVAPGATARVVFKVNLVDAGTSGQGVLLGFNRGTVGAAPSAGGAQSRGLYFRYNGTSGSGGLAPLDNGTQGTPLVSTGLGNATFYVTLTVDENYYSISATAATGGSPRYYSRWARDDATFPLNNLTIMINDARGTSGTSVEPITEARIGGIVTGAALTGGIGAHWGSSSGDNFLILTPATYDARRPSPAVIVFHGNGSDETHWTTNANGKAVADAFLAQGYIVIAAANTGATSTWGSQAGIDAYVRAYQYARDHYNVGALAFYGNSMGGIESLIALAGESIPGVAAWMGTVPTYDLAENHDNALFTATINSAYGGNYAANSVGRDPALMNPLAFRGVPMWMLLATDDAAVTPGPNGFALYDAIENTNPRTKVEVTGGHSTSQIASNAPAMVTWCNGILGLRNSYPA